jgi:hypothetical protein
MGDVIYVGLTVLLFILTVGFSLVCEKLMEKKP